MNPIGPTSLNRLDEGATGSVKLAIHGVWAGIGLSALVALADKLIGGVTAETFVCEVLGYGLLCIIPYKLQQRSNAARYWLLVLSIIGTLFELGGVSKLPRLDLVVGWVWTPISLAILFILFSKQGSEYFSGKRCQVAPQRIEPDLGH